KSIHFLLSSPCPPCLRGEFFLRGRHPPRMARRRAIWLLALSLAGAAGCRSRSDLVEAELRTKDRQLRETRGELMRAETMNEALENTLRDQRHAQPVARTGSLGLVKDI